MTASRKLFSGLTLRCLGAIGVGLAFVIVITTGLIVISADNDTIAATKSAAYTLKFPEDEQMLKDMSAQILKDSNLASSKKAASVEPAAGGTAE